MKLIRFLFLTCLFVEFTGAEPLPLLTLSIDEYVDMALDRSIRSQINDENLKNSRWSWLSGRRQLTWPQLSASAGASRAMSDDDLGTESISDSGQASLTFEQPFLTGTDFTLSGTWSSFDTETETGGSTSLSKSKTRPDVTASINQPLYVFVKNNRYRSWESNKLQWDTTRSFYDLDRLSIEFDAKTIYYRLLGQFKIIEVEKRKLEASEAILEQTEKLVERGKVQPVELSRINVAVEQDRRQVKNAETNYHQELNQARDFILLANDQPIEFNTPLEYQKLDLSLDNLIEKAIQENPSLKAASNNLRLTEISYEQSKEGDRPTMSVSGTYSKRFDSNNTQADTIPESWDTRVDIDWRFFDASLSRLAEKQAITNYRVAQRSYENEVRRIKLDVENAYLDLKRIEAQVEEFSQQSEKARQNSIDIRQEFERGRAGITDILDAEERYRNLELEYIGLLVDYNSARDNLNRLIGGTIIF